MPKKRRSSGYSKNGGEVFEIERDGDRWYLLTRTPLTVPGALRLAPVVRELALLTPAERRIFDLMSEGKINKEIAADLGMQVRTVKFHVSSILRKSGCADRYDLFRQFGGRSASDRANKGETICEKQS